MSKNKSKKLIVLASGGTGGHIFPAQALAERLDKDYQLLLVTDARAKKFLSSTLSKIQRITLKVGPISGPLHQKVNNAFHLAFGVIYTYFKFLFRRPSVVVGFGGYSSFSAIAAAILLNIPVIVHEQNSLMGKVNRMFAPFARKIATSFQNTLNIPKKYQHKVVHTGNPVRSSVESLSKTFGKKKLRDDFSIVVIGGSQGASIFGKNIPQSIQNMDDEMQSKIKIHHQVRANLANDIELEYKKTKCQFELKAFYNNIAELMHSCDLVIARAGASTIAELLTLVKPSILIPFAAAADNHQFHNAQHLVECGGAMLILEKEFNKNRLSKLLSSFLRESEQLKDMQENLEKIKVRNAKNDLYLLLKNYLQ